MEEIELSFLEEKVIKMKSVLIIDDSTIIRKTIKDIVESANYQVIGEAEDGESGVKRYKKLKPDIVTLDITMPKKNGIDCLEEILKYDINAKIIIVSAINETELVLEAVEKGAVHYVIKPIKKEKMIKVMDDIKKYKF